MSHQILMLFKMKKNEEMNCNESEYNNIDVKSIKYEVKILWSFYHETLNGRKQK